MIKKYTKENEQQIISLLEKLDANNNDQFNLESKLSNWIGEIKSMVTSFWSSGNIVFVGKYFKEARNANNNARLKVKRIFFKVRSDDRTFGQKLTN